MKKIVELPVPMWPLYKIWRKFLVRRSFPFSDYDLDVSKYDNNTYYDDSTIFYTQSDLIAPVDQNTIKEFKENLITKLDPNRKYILEKLWDTKVNEPCSYHDNNRILYLTVRDYLRIQVFVFFIDHEYQNLTFNKNPQQFCLCLMRQPKELRDLFFEKTKDFHNDSIISYLGRNFKTHSTLGEINPNYLDTTGEWASTIGNQAWYENTYFSLVVESFPEVELFVSEKIFKPIAFQHPFVLYGSQYSLKYLKLLGYETFDHIIDESYDEIADPIERMNSVLEVVKNLYSEYKNGQSIFSDNVTKEKLKHNYNLFYNFKDVEQRFVEQYVNIIHKF